MLRTQTKSIQGRSIHFAHGGRLMGERIVFFGAWPQSIIGWTAVLEKVDPHYQWVALDLPGFGHSQGLPPAKGVIGPWEIAHWLAQNHEALGLKSCHLVAPDVGVPVALALATLLPTEIKSLTLSDGPGTWPAQFSWDLERMVDSKMARWLFSLSTQGFVDSAIDRGYHRQTPSAAVIQDYRRAYGHSGRLEASLDFLSTYPQALPKIDLALPGMMVPTLTLWGAEDAFVPPINGAWIAEKMPHAKAQVLPNTGHFSHEDNPEAYAQALLTWLKSQP